MTRRPLLVGLIALLCLAAAVAIAVLAFADSDDASRLEGTILAVFVYSVVGLAGLALLQRRSFFPLGAGAVALSVAALSVLTVLIWTDDPGEGLVKAAGALFVGALAFAYASVVVWRARPRDTRAVNAIRALALLLDGALAVMLVIAILEQIGEGGYYRWIGAVAALLTLCTLLVPLVRNIAGDTPRD